MTRYLLMKIKIFLPNLPQHTYYTARDNNAIEIIMVNTQQSLLISWNQRFEMD